MGTEERAGGPSAERAGRAKSSISFSPPKRQVSTPDNTRLSPRQEHRYHLVRSQPKSKAPALATIRDAVFAASWVPFSPVRTVDETSPQRGKPFVSELGKTPSHGGNTGSNPVGDAKQISDLSNKAAVGVPVMSRQGISRTGVRRWAEDAMKSEPGSPMKLGGAAAAGVRPAPPSNGLPALPRPPCLGRRHDPGAADARSPQSRGRARAWLPSSFNSPSDHSLPAFSAGASSSASAPCGSRIEAPIRRNSASCSGFCGPLRNAPSSISVT